MRADTETGVKGSEIWTIGHSTRTQAEFLGCLTSFGIQILVDVRRFPGSRKYPHFNTGAVEKYLPENGIKYIQLEALGGRRKPLPDSKNTVWQNEAFRGYADYTASPDFLKAITGLAELATPSRTAYMCSEAVSWRCHRSIMSDSQGAWLEGHAHHE